MKRGKIYCAILLILSIIFSSNFAAMASGTEYAINWLHSYKNDVDSYFYTLRTPFGFIIRGYRSETKEHTTTLINDTGIVIPTSTNNFNEIRYPDNFRFYSESGDGIMDINGNIVIEAGNHFIRPITADRFFISKYDEEAAISKQGIIDRNGNEIVPLGKYTIELVTYYLDGHYYKNFICNQNGHSVHIDYDGNILKTYKTYDSSHYMEDLSLVYDEVKNKSYLQNKENSVMAEFNGKANLAWEGYVEVYERDKDGNKILYEYDLNGKLINTVNYGNKGRYEYKDEPRYMLDKKYENKTLNYTVKDTTTGKTYNFNDVDFSISYVYESGLMHLHSNSDYTDGIMTLNGEMVVPFGKYDDITYCSNLDIYALIKTDYQNYPSTEITIVKISPITVNVSGNNVIFDQNPISKDGRTLVPLRAIFEALGATVDWDASTQTVTSTLNGTTIRLTIDTNKMFVNNAEITLDVPATIVNGRTLVPVRAISEAFGCDVAWDDATRTVTITS